MNKPPSKRLCRHATVLVAGQIYCEILKKPVSRENDCETCDCYKAVM